MDCANGEVGVGMEGRELGQLTQTVDDRAVAGNHVTLRGSPVDRRPVGQLERDLQ